MAVSGEKTQTKSVIPDKILEKVSAFPSMPKAGAKLRALLDQKNVPLTEIEKILRHDPGLAANVLRLANSAYFGIPAKVTTLKHAIILLGVKRVSKIAVAASMNKIMVNAVHWHHYPQGLENSNLHPEIVYLANLL
ncbi:MAG: HDOD domain-containing protein [Desulfobacterales bacterium]|jgi:HD-like signal output (HDOD) protein